jgi:hypothetical protein
MHYYDSPDITIDWDEQTKSVVMKWKGFVSGEDFRSEVVKGLELIKGKKGVKWLADLSEMGVIAQEDQKWTDQIWFPQAVKEGIKFIAIVRPHKMVSQMSVKNVVMNINGLDIESEYFDTIENAKVWINMKI